jgi:tight adherence protein C
MIAMALVGATVGALAFTLLVIAFPPRRAAVVELGRFYAHYRTPQRYGQQSASSQFAPSSATTLSGWRERVGAVVARELAIRGVRWVGLRRDLALTGLRFETVVGRKVLSAVAGFLTACLVFSVLAYRGLSLPAGTPLAVATLLAAALFVAPDIDIRKEAARRRREFTQQLSIYLDLVALEMAGHAAAETALPRAAQLGGAWPMLLIRDTLARARLAGQDSWEALSSLGERIDVPDLRELGALIKLVSADGAQVRSTLTQRAASMRRARLAEEEGDAGERDQSIRLAQTLIAVGFMIFVGYPAFVAINF